MISRMIVQILRSTKKETKRKEMKEGLASECFETRTSLYLITDYLLMDLFITLSS
jgi:hypothetical protein